jgi:protein TonB
VVIGGAVKRVEPAYPLTAKTARQTGVVTVEVTINEHGNVASARATSGPPLLREAAVSAARGWKFKPSTRAGLPVVTVTTIVFNFKL